jgi:hypothetical protein
VYAEKGSAVINRQTWIHLQIDSKFECLLCALQINSKFEWLIRIVH